MDFKLFQSEDAPPEKPKIGVQTVTDAIGSSGIKLRPEMLGDTTRIPIPGKGIKVEPESGGEQLMTKTSFLSNIPFKKILIWGAIIFVAYKVLK